MFGKKNDIPPKLNTDKVDTIIGKDTEFNGTFHARGVIRIDGKVDGEILTQGDIIVGETGKIIGDIKARHITLAGEMHGNAIVQGRLEITSTGKLFGDIEVSNLVVNDGAVFDGKCEMKNDKGDAVNSNNRKD